jgi:hypothetical protein
MKPSQRYMGKWEDRTQKEKEDQERRNLTALEPLNPASETGQIHEFPVR